MVSNQLATDNVEVKIKTIYQNTGTFVNEEGVGIDFENYTGIMEIEGAKVKFKVDKSFNEIMRDLVNDYNLLNI